MKLLIGILFISLGACNREITPGKCYKDNEGNPLLISVRGVTAESIYVLFISSNSTYTTLNRATFEGHLYSGSIIETDSEECK